MPTVSRSILTTGPKKHRLLVTDVITNTNSPYKQTNELQLPIMDTIDSVVRDFQELRERRKTDKYGIPTDPDVKTQLQGRFNNLFTAISAAGIAEDPDSRRRVEHHFFTALQHICDQSFIKDLAEPERKRRLEMFFLLKLFAETRVLDLVLFGPQQIDYAYEIFAAYEKWRRGVEEYSVSRRLVAEVFYPLYLDLVNGDDHRTPRSMGQFPDLFTNSRHASTIITSNEAGVGGSHYEWMRQQRDKFVSWYHEAKVGKKFQLELVDQEAFEYWDTKQMMQFAKINSIIDDKVIQYAAAKAKNNPNAYAAIAILERLEHQVTKTERTMWERFFLAGREFLFGTPRHCNPTEREQCIAETAAKLVDEIGAIVRRHPDNPKITTMSERLIATLSEPGMPLFNRTKREIEGEPYLGYEGDDPDDEDEFLQRTKQQKKQTKAKFNAILGGSAIAFAIGTHPLVRLEAMGDEKKHLSTNQLPKTPSVVEEVFLIREARIQMKAQAVR